MRKNLHSFSQFLVWAALAGLLVPVAPASAAEPHALPVAAHRDASRAIEDAALSKDGTLTGRVYNAQGSPLADTDVLVVTLAGQSVRARTSEQGEFAVRGLKGGVYRVVSGHGGQVVRAWAEGTAPPSASREILIVSDPRVVLGQWEPGTFGYFLQEAKYTLSNPLVVGGIIAAAVAIPVAIHNANDDDPPSGS